MNRKLVSGQTAAAVALLLGLGIPAHAADLSPNFKTPPAAPVAYNYSGFYLGANLGGTFDGENIATPLGNFSTDPSGVLGGFQSGYNLMFSANWLVGVEGELAWTAGQGIANFNNNLDVGSLTSSHGWYDTLDGRLGYVIGPFLLYGKGGAAWMEAEYTLTGTGAGIGTNVTSSMRPIRTGWNAGAGLEYMLSPLWSVKLEYDFLDFGSRTFNFGIPIVGPSLAIATTVQEVKFGVNLHWQPGNVLGGL